MRLIISRKGFDSTSGGCPSPILPDGSLLSLPIPDSQSIITFQDIQHPEVDLASIAKDLTRGLITPQSGAHLDPDLLDASLPRMPGWRPMLGQTGSAQGHLANQQIEPGDLFLFFGLYREVEQLDGQWRFKANTLPHHRLWGWLQIGEIVKVDQLKTEQMKWARYHPHFQMFPDPHNTLYVSSNQLTLFGQQLSLAGSGVFPSVTESHKLTASDSRKPSDWRVPGWMFPEQGKAPLSYHSRPDRWQKQGEFCRLRSVARGQEFVLSGDDYPQLNAWLLSLW